MQKRLAQEVAEFRLLTPDEFAKFVDFEIERWRPTIRAMTPVKNWVVTCRTIRQAGEVACRTSPDGNNVRAWDTSWWKLPLARRSTSKSSDPRRPRSL